jgi:hypothetical protein
MRSPLRTARPLIALTAMVVAFALTAASPASATIANGRADSTWMTNGNVFATAQYGNVLFIGGDFTSVRSSPPGTPSTIIKLNNLAAINMTTGAAISSFHPSVTENDFTPTTKGLVRSLAIVGDKLYVGGQFTTVDGASHYNVAAIDIDPVALTGAVDPTFNATVGVPGAANANTFFVYKVLPGPTGLYVGGVFAKVNGVPEVKAAELNWDGSVNTAFTTKGINGAIRDMQMSLDGNTIFAAGKFSTFDGAAIQSVVRISATTGALDTWQIPAGEVQVGGPTAPHPGQICWSMVVTDTRLFVGCGNTPNFVDAFRLDNGDSGDRTWQFNTSGNDQALALTADGQSLLFGGHFGTYLTMNVCAPGKYLKNLGTLHNLFGFTSPSLDCGFLPQFWGPDPFGGVWTIQVTATQIWAGGMFTMANCDMVPAEPGQPSSVGCPNGVGQRGIVRFSSS